MKPVMILFSMLLTNLANATCPELPFAWYVKQLTANVTELSGDYTFTIDVPDLKNMNCVVDASNSILTFDLSNAPITVQIKNVSLNKLIHKIQYKAVLLSSVIGFELRKPSKEVPERAPRSIFISTYTSPGDYLESSYNYKYKVVSRW